MDASVYKSAAYFYYVQKILGIAPYTFNGRSQSFRTTIWDYMRLIGTLIFWIYINVIHLKTYDQKRYRAGIKFTIVESLWINTYAFQNLTIIIIVIFNFFKRKNVEKFLKFLHNFDTRIAKLGWHRAGQNSILGYTLQLASLLLSIILIYFWAREWNGIDSLDRFNFYLKYFAFISIIGTFFIISMVFIGSCCCVIARLDALLKNMR